MKYIFLILITLNNYLFVDNPFYNTFISSNEEETKEVINRENRNGMLIGLLGSLVIIEIGLIYKKKKIKL